MLTENDVSFFLQCNFELSTIYKFVLTHFEYISIPRGDYHSHTRCKITHDLKLNALNLVQFAMNCFIRPF